MRKRRRNAELVAERLELPAEALGALLVTAVGRRRVLIENHRGIELFSDACLRLRAAGGSFTVYGSDLRIRALSGSTLALEGDIGSMEWEG